MALLKKLAVLVLWFKTFIIYGQGYRQNRNNVTNIAAETIFGWYLQVTVKDILGWCFSLKI